MNVVSVNTVKITVVKRIEKKNKIFKNTSEIGLPEFIIKNSTDCANFALYTKKFYKVNRSAFFIFLTLLCLYPAAFLAETSYKL